MAKRAKVLPARRHDEARDDESLLMRSAESLGRMIGSLQRQLDGASRRLSDTTDDVMENLPELPLAGGYGARKSGTKKRVAKRTTRAAASRKNSSARNAAKTAGGTRKRSATARKRAGSKKR